MTYFVFVVIVFAVILITATCFSYYIGWYKGNREELDRRVQKNIAHYNFGIDKGRELQVEDDLAICDELCGATPEDVAAAIRAKYEKENPE